jgi:hypothetical protein
VVNLPLKTYIRGLVGPIQVYFLNGLTISKTFWEVVDHPLDLWGGRSSLESFESGQATFKSICTGQPPSLSGYQSHFCNFIFAAK